MFRLNRFLAGALLLAAAPSCAFSQLPAASTAAQLDEARMVALPGNVHPLARAEFEAGALAPETRLEHMVLLLTPTPARQAALSALLAAQHDPRSPQFHKWLTPAAYAARFGVSAAELARVQGWLRSHGLMVDELPAGNRLVVFSGAAAQVEEAFHPSLRAYRVNGALHLANSQDPQIPEALAATVAGVVSLHDFRRTPAGAVRRSLGARPQWTLGGSHYLFPADYAAIYNLNPLYSAGTAGAGVTIAVAGRSNILPADVAAFRAAAGLAANDPTVLVNGTDPKLVNGDQDEATLDVEWAGAVAPAAQVQLVASASTSTTDGIDLSAAYIVSHALAPVVSVSYGSCEQQMGATELAFYNAMWQQAASQGMSVFVASGDSGAAGCTLGYSLNATQAGINGLCSSPYATCVGGTEFNEAGNDAAYWSASNSAANSTALGYIPEKVWNESGLDGGTGLWASGGGVSQVYAQPAWQAGVEGAAVANGMRAVPDVSMTAAGHDGSVIYENGDYWIVSGTSAAAPAVAGLMALVVEAQKGVAQGNANPALYALLSAPVNPFHSTQTGNNAVPGVAGYAASGAAYNLATGLGSVDGALLVENWGLTAAPAATLKLAAVAGPIAVTQGAARTVELTAVTGGSFSGAVTLAVCGLPRGVTAVWSANPLLPQAGSTSATLTLRAGLAVATGAATVTVTAQGGGITATQQFELDVALSPVWSRRPPSTGGIVRGPAAGSAASQPERTTGLARKPAGSAAPGRRAVRPATD